ncbi:hypothetical protein Syun_005705 [Stephania yunnanensis]|uniref:Uncharacterized protein n=1 Tax=Stephania yunnanensis TaxID=152371 RepID=A0AAP0L5A5_9MAGN
MLPPYMKFSTSARGTSPPRNAGTYHIYGHSFAVMDVYVSPITLKDIYIFYAYMKFSTSARGTSPPRNAGTYNIYGHTYMKFSTSAGGTSPPRNAGTYNIYEHSFAVINNKLSQNSN